MSILHVVFRVADADYLVAAADVLQMESYAGATRVPGALPYVAGVVQVRGRVVPVVDLRVRFGLPAVEATLDSRIVVVQHRERTVGLLVDSAREVIKLTPEQLQPPPRMVADGDEGFVKAVAHLGQRLLMLVDFVKVIGEDSTHVS
jgi:purine-binding chemotaxis protein CheW